MGMLIICFVKYLGRLKINCLLEEKTEPGKTLTTNRTNSNTSRLIE